MCVLSVVIWSSYSLTINGKLQTVIQAFANALEVIPRQLSENAGFNGIEIMNLLRNKHANTVCIFSHYCYEFASLLAGMVWTSTMKESAMKSKRECGSPSSPS